MFFFRKFSKSFSSFPDYRWITEFQNFLNELLWSPHSLESDILSADQVERVRRLLMAMLQRDLPTTFDDLPREIAESLL